jgi:copper homeostasis protein (lipoprotein)
VAAGAAASAMQAEATRLRGGAGEILVSVEGRVDSVARADGSAQPVLAVQRYIGAWPGETCGVRFGTAELTNTLWKLTALNGAPVIAVSGQREPSLVLASADGRRVARGSTGCESFAGTYQLDGNALRLAVQARPGSCPATAAERGYLDALAGVRTWRIVGQHLELYDAQGTMLARYEARALR